MRFSRGPWESVCAVSGPVNDGEWHLSEGCCTTYICTLTKFVVLSSHKCNITICIIHITWLIFLGSGVNLLFVCKKSNTHFLLRVKICNLNTTRATHKRSCWPILGGGGNNVYFFILNHFFMDHCLLRTYHVIDTNIPCYNDSTIVKL